MMFLKRHPVDGQLASCAVVSCVYVHVAPHVFHRKFRSTIVDINAIKYK